MPGARMIHVTGRSKKMSGQKIRAPELPADLEWFNTDRPIQLAEQRGKVVLLHFWTSCSINCMHVLQELAWLERTHADNLMVVGIHTPKFPNERLTETVQKAINRYYIRHPVVSDPGFKMWQQYNIKAWPSLIYIDPEGYIRGVLRGEGRRKQLDEMITKSLEQAQAKGVYSAMPYRASPKPEKASELKFPGNVLASNERLFISDSGNNRILEAMPNGRIMHIYGGGTAGLVDGNTSEACFNNPQGMTLMEGGILLVADTGNHAIRKINLSTRDVETVAGNGRLSKTLAERSEDLLGTSLNSPWDIIYKDGMAYIAMAGSHQIWVMSLNSGYIDIFSGNGREDLRDGPPEVACYAQPSALSIGEDVEPVIFVADAESSSIRVVRFRDSSTRTIVGKGLFEFGDADGKGVEAKLQHPLGIEYDPQRKGVWIADSFNHKIKFLNLTQQAVTSLKLDRTLSEPGGISIMGNTLWVANTNAHEILSIDLGTREVTELEVFAVERD